MDVNKMKNRKVLKRLFNALIYVVTLILTMLIMVFEVIYSVSLFEGVRLGGVEARNIIVLVACTMVCLIGWKILINRRPF